VHVGKQAIDAKSAAVSPEEIGAMPWIESKERRF
jgi:hypothetical protein